MTVSDLCWTFSFWTLAVVIWTARENEKRSWPLLTVNGWCISFVSELRQVLARVILMGRSHCRSDYLESDSEMAYCRMMRVCEKPHKNRCLVDGSSDGRKPRFERVGLLSEISKRRSSLA